ncbi:MAG: hypothetical protein RL189_2086, partial [Pseudomonadota bacterium]
LWDAGSDVWQIGPLTRLPASLVWLVILGGIWAVFAFFLIWKIGPENLRQTLERQLKRIVKR